MNIVFFKAYQPKSVHGLTHEHSCQKDKNIRLYKTIKKIKIQAEWNRQYCRAHEFYKCHNHKSSKNVSEKPEAKCCRTDKNLHDVHGKHHRNRIQKTLKKAFQSFLMDASVFNEKHAHKSQGKSNIQILGRWLHSKNP